MQVMNGDTFTDDLNSIKKDRDAGMYYDLFRTLFNPSEPIAHLIDNKLQSRHLVPREFIGAHYRAFYRTRDTKVGVNPDSISNFKQLMQLTVHQHSILGGPIYFASESQLAIIEAQRIAKEFQCPIVTFPHEEDALHLDKTEDWMARNASDFYSAFVDVLVMVDSHCITHSKGGFGQFASL
jgi:hypothetical protein